MKTFLYIVSVECETEEQAEEVMSERIGYDEDYGFEYKLSVKRATEGEK